MKRNWQRLIGRVMMGAVVLLSLLYAADWAVLRLRMSRGTAFGVVAVDQFLATPLKGNKAEYDLMGTIQEACSRSIFPQNGKPPCWWLQRHTSHWE